MTVHELRNFNSCVQAMPAGTRAQFRAHLEGVFANDEQPMAIRVRARLLADVVAAIDGEDHDVALARSRDVVDMVAQFAELRALPIATEKAA